MELLNLKEYNRPKLGQDDWPEGVSNSEPNKRSWTDAETGLPCLMVRSDLGIWCGYVAVDEKHPLYGVEAYDANLDAHGGITFAGPCQDVEDEAEGVCHIPQPGESDNVWWFGFDCGHYRDYLPGMLFPFGQLIDGQTYRDVAYVQNEVTQLAKQLKEYSNVDDQHPN